MYLCIFTFSRHSPQFGSAMTLILLKDWLYPIKYVTGQCLFNVPDVTLVPNFGRILVASLSNVNVSSCYGAIIGILWIIGCSLQGTVLNMVSSVFDVVNYNSDNVL